MSLYGASDMPDHVVVTITMVSPMVMGGERPCAARHQTCPKTDGICKSTSAADWPLARPIVGPSIVQ